MSKESIEGAKERENLIKKQKDISRELNWEWSGRQQDLEREAQPLSERISDKIIGIDMPKEMKKGRNERIKSLLKEYGENLKEMLSKTEDFKKDTADLIISPAPPSEEDISGKTGSENNKERELTKEELEGMRKYLRVREDDEREGLIYFLKETGLDPQLRKEIEEAEKEIAENKQKDS